MTATNYETAPTNGIDVLGLVRATILVTDHLGTVIQAHGGAGRPLGFEPDELVGRNGLDFVASEDHPVMAGLYTSPVAPLVQAPEPFPVRAIGPDGVSRVWDCIPTGFDHEGQQGWIVTLTCRKEQNPSIDAMECFISGGTPLEIADLAAQRYRGDLAGGWRKASLVIHRDVDTHGLPGPWQALAPTIHWDRTIFDALEASLHQADAPWNLLDPDDMIAGCALPEQLHAAAANAGLEHCAATAVGLDGVTHMVFLRLSNYPLLMQANNQLADLAISGILQRSLMAEQARTQLDNAMRCDPLTGVSNRRHFEEIMVERRDVSTDAALFVDIDSFKNVNDKYGHAAGDATLRAVAERITQACRSQDTVARVGGDEFAIILRDVTAAETKDIAARIRTLMDEPLKLESAPDTVSVSVGVAIPGDETTLAAMVQRADHAMLADKAANRHGKA